MTIIINNKLTLSRTQGVFRQTFITIKIEDGVSESQWTRVFETLDPEFMNQNMTPKKTVENYLSK